MRLFIDLVKFLVNNREGIGITNVRICWYPTKPVPSETDFCYTKLNVIDFIGLG